MRDRRPRAAGPARALWILLLETLAFALSFAAAPAGAADPAPLVEPPVVVAIAARLEQDKDRARLVFETSAELAVDAFPVADPYRIVVDLPEVAFRIDPDAGRPKQARDAERLVTSFRFGQFAPGRSRIVVDLARPARILRAASDSKLKNPRLVIELERTDAESFAAEAAARARAAAAPPTAEEPAPPSASARPVLVIDPGHGGVDVGAAGAHGEQEKSIVLEFARALKSRLEAGGRLDVVLTRSDDSFMALDERVRIAKRAGAGLFLSIHADTLNERNVEGATVYTASARASDAEAAKIAEKENFADRAAGLESKSKSEDSSEVGDILYDLARRETRAYSHAFAHSLIAYWQTVGHLNKNPSRSAGFVVLKAFDVPSVLLELGYLSSARDLSRLVSPEWRERAAEVTAQAVETYFAERGAAQTPREVAQTRPQ